MTTKLVPKGHLQYTVQARGEDVTKHNVSFVLMERCPAVLLELEGLTDDYDYYQTCHAGACVGPRGVQTLQLAPGERSVAMAGAWRSLVWVLLSD